MAVPDARCVTRLRADNTEATAATADETVRVTDEEDEEERCTLALADPGCVTEARRLDRTCGVAAALVLQRTRPRA